MFIYLSFPDGVLNVREYVDVEVTSLGIILAKLSILVIEGSIGKTNEMGGPVLVERIYGSGRK